YQAGMNSYGIFYTRRYVPFDRISSDEFVIGCSDYRVVDLSSNFAFRHNGACSLLFGDFHVESRRPKEFSDDVVPVHRFRRERGRHGVASGAAPERLTSRTAEMVWKIRPVKPTAIRAARKSSAAWVTRSGRTEWSTAATGPKRASIALNSVGPNAARRNSPMILARMLVSTAVA